MGDDDQISGGVISDVQEVGKISESSQAYMIASIGDMSDSQTCMIAGWGKEDKLSGSGGTSDSQTCMIADKLSSIGGKSDSQTYQSLTNSETECYMVQCLHQPA